MEDRTQASFYSGMFASTSGTAGGGATNSSNISTNSTSSSTSAAAEAVNNNNNNIQIDINNGIQQLQQPVILGQNDVPFEQ